MRDFDRVRDKIEILLEPRQVALLAAGTMLLCGGIFAVGFGVGRHSAPAATSVATLRDIDASAAVVAAASPPSTHAAPSATGEVEFLFPSALSSRPGRPAPVVPVIRAATPAPKVAAEPVAKVDVPEPRLEPVAPAPRAEPAPRAPRPEPVRVARVEPAPRAPRSAAPVPAPAVRPVAPAISPVAARDARMAALAEEDESELEERPMMAARPAPARVAATSAPAPAPRIDLSPVAPRSVAAAAIAPPPVAPAPVVARSVPDLPVVKLVPPSAAAPAAAAPSAGASLAKAPGSASPSVAARAVSEDDGRPRYTLQLKAAKSQTEVDEYVRALSEKGVKVHTVLANVPGKGRVYRIRVGRFSSRAEARKFQEDMMRKADLTDGGFITEL